MKSREDWLRLFAMLGEEACKILSATAPDVLSWHNLESKFFENTFPPVPASSRIDYKPKCRSWILVFSRKDRKDYYNWGVLRIIQDHLPF